ncbi:MAG: STAS domain-containing protein [Acidobacteriia bacterium]|nr:STAS domain-containing protein [Terriglobia bacterium]
MKLHEDPLARELLIAAYLQRRLDEEAAEAFESHYLGCDRCFEELEAAELLAAALRDRKLRRDQSADVLLLRFADPAELIFGSRELAELAGCLAEPRDSKVVLDLSRVSRIDSSGLGELMRLHAHLLRASGALKLVSPSAPVARLFRVTHIDSILDTYENENAALDSFALR